MPDDAVAPDAEVRLVHPWVEEEPAAPLAAAPPAAWWTARTLASDDFDREDRTEDLPYLLAGLRLRRIAEPVRRSDAQRRVARIRRHLEG